MAPSKTAAATATVKSIPPIWKASGIMVGRSMAIVVQDVPIEKAINAANRNTRIGRKVASRNPDSAATR